MSPMYMDSAQAFLEHAPRTLLREDAKRATKRTDNQQRPRWRNAGALRSPGSAVTTTKTKTEVGTRSTANCSKEQGKTSYSGERLSTAQAKEIHQEAMRVAKATSTLNKEILHFSEDLHVSRALLRAQLASIREKLTALT